VQIDNQNGNDSMDWAKDPLSSFLKVANYNVYATSRNLGPQFNLLRDIHIAYKQISDNLSNRSNIFSTFFFYRCHMSFLASVQLGAGGQLSAAHSVVRSCLEAALYGYEISVSTDSLELWLSRHDTTESRKKVGRKFGPKNLINTLRSCDDCTANIAEQLYDRTIDYGAHPNERAILPKKFDKSEKTIDISFDAFEVGTIEHLACLKTIATVGVCTLDIFRHIWPELYDSVGVSRTLDTFHHIL